MGIMSSRRSVAGGSVLAMLACASALVAATQAHGAATTYPAGASTFDGSTQGWADSAASCGPADLVGLACTGENVYDPSIGNPGGSIATRLGVTANALGTFFATGTWTSPSFTVSAEEPVTGATFSYDRRLDSGSSLVDLTPTSEIAVALLDETAGTTVPVLTDTITNANSSFAPLTGIVPAGSIVDGHAYRLRIETTMTSSVVTAAAGEAFTRFDNVGLAVETGGSGGGSADDGSGNSPGVTVVRGPYGDAQIADLIARYGRMIDADTGKGRDGSLIPLHLCTIIGTSGPDRINGTTGNDVICGLGGLDEITGVGRRDVIDGASGNDRLSGGIGDDLLLGLAGNDRLDGGADKDRIGGGANNDRIESGNGDDVSSGGSGNDAVGGSAGNDTLRGLAGNDRMNGGPGRDRVYGGAGNDVLRGFSGPDRLAGGRGADRLLVRDGRRDVANGGPGRDRALADRSDRVRRVQGLRRR